MVKFILKITIKMGQNNNQNMVKITIKIRKTGQNNFIQLVHFQQKPLVIATFALQLLFDLPLHD